MNSQMSAGPVRYGPAPAQGRLRQRLKRTAAREWPAPVKGIWLPLMLWQCRWTAIPVNMAIQVTTMVKRQISVRVFMRKKCSNTNSMAMMMMELFPRMGQTVRGDDELDAQDRQDFIRASAELFDSDGAKKSSGRLAGFTKGDLLERLL
jgi:hypothetical protein